MTSINDHELQKWVDEKISSGKSLDNLNEDQKEALNELFKFTPPANLSIDKQIAWKKVSDRITPKKKEKESNSFTIWKVAAALALFMVVSFSIIWFIYYRPQEMVYSTGSSPKQFTLTDGSVVTLNKNSTLKLMSHFNSDHRKVYLTGEAFFSITKSKAGKTFNIETSNGNVEVLGTVFNVKTTNPNSKESETTVYVQSGVVSLSDSNEEKSIQLAEGEVGSLNTSGDLVKEVASNENMLFWKTNRMKFKSEKLGVIIANITQHLAVSVKIEDHLTDCIVTFNYQGGDVESFLKNIQKITDLTFTKKESIYYLSGKGCY